MIRGFPSQDARKISQARLCLGDVTPESGKTVPSASFELQPVVTDPVGASQVGGSHSAPQINRLKEQRERVASRTPHKLVSSALLPALAELRPAGRKDTPISWVYGFAIANSDCVSAEPCTLRGQRTSR